MHLFMKTLSLLTTITLLGLSAASSSAAVIALNLEGKGGIGLLASNENGTVNGAFGSGGEVGGGISYDDVSNLLTINVAWGLTNGFSSLTGNASAGHIHGPTASSGVGSFTQNAGVIFGLDSGVTWNNSATSGGVTGRTITLTETQEGQLLAGRYYINVHTSLNGGGEIRGNIVVPETSTSVLASTALGLMIRRRRRA
jgi:hypothetical protein